MHYKDYDRKSDRLECHDWDTDGFPGEFVHGDDVCLPDQYLDERWKCIQDFPDYWISNMGRIWSERSQCFVYGTPIGRCGHIDVSLHRDGIRYHRYIHRLVAEAFKPNPFKYPFVRHLDDDPSNNYVENLDWGTQTDNVQDSINNGHFYYLDESDREKAMQKRRMPIIAVNIRTGEQIRFESQQEASRRLKLNQSSINAVINGRRSRAGCWYFAKDGKEINDLSRIDIYHHAKIPPIRAINLETGEHFRFNGLTQAANCLGMSIASISLVLHGKQYSAKGWKFKYIDEEMY